jgi:hypothetical protein
LSGFSSVVLKDVELLVGNTLAIPFTMKLAQVSETAHGHRRNAARRHRVVAGGGQRRSASDGGTAAQGRNWMELSKLVKGITANDVTESAGRRERRQLSAQPRRTTDHPEDRWLRIRQPRFSRESIAEFQISALFDVTQGRSAGIEVHAITRSGTNKNSGSVYGFFRSDKFNSKDAVANKVLPYQNQQVGGAFGGPIVKDKMHYFASYEYEREPGTISTTPAIFQVAGQAPLTYEIPYKNNQKSLLARVDDQLSSKDRLTIRGSRWDWENPFVLGAGGHPSNSSVQTKNATNIVGSGTR